MPSGWATSHGSRALCLETVVCLGGVFLPPWRPRQLFFISAPFPWPRQQAVGVASWVKATPACSEPGCGHGRALPDTVLLPHRGHREPAGVGGGEHRGRVQGGLRGGVSGRRCHCRGIWPGWRRGEREGEEEPGTLGMRDSPHTPPPTLPVCPQDPSASPCPVPPPASPPRDLVPPFPSPVSREIQMFGPSSGIAQPRCPARCFLSPPPPRAGVCAPRLGTLGRGTVLPPCQHLHRAFSRVPCNTRGIAGSFPLPALASPGACCCL